MLSPEEVRFFQQMYECLRNPQGCPRSAVFYACGQAATMGPEFADEFLKTMLDKGLISESPDGQLYKWTDYGLAVYEETESLQEAWLQSAVVPSDEAKKDQVVIRQGETFRGKYYVMEFLKQAKWQIQIQDNYCSHELFAWLYSVTDSVMIQVITSNKALTQDKTFEAVYRAFHKERPNSEVRLSDALHDRKLIRDETEGFQVGESLKDIGKKGTTVARLREIQTHVAEFEELWKSAKPI